MNALFTENGPLRIKQTGENDSNGYEITYEPENAWSAAGDLLFIDQPVGTGWSYGSHAATSLDEIGSDFLTFL
jgi:carboxypeptidase C (cathepsin A)